ncbi:putative FYVE, RhoGEF and PH domain-containing protein 2 [Trypanosoma conorhini]|uniref:Putative FYVE, RhoGEF and PH domain-containing protein 2 n=1 Tax=Trypanosoma conorhini TaxID=83891 RepID=A0A422MZL6_9TRYP|nr:putative FYVE, RhoGEF and PH domain-containing protein 2 [Trypanosoma conorhini]RNE98668.1 putative FYVE, RhoGEF and PH domain-containing protein 2 [Trypanosoma conorhini]
MPQAVQNAAMPFVPPPSHSEDAVTSPTVSRDGSALAQEEEDRKQLEKITQLRKELEKERERERKKREELETWGCPSCTYRNALDVNQCEMCDSNRPGYLPSPNVAPPPTTRSDAPSSFTPHPKGATVPSELAGPTAWLCSICLAPNEAHHSRCKICGSYQKNGTPISEFNANSTGVTAGVPMPPSAWLCSICGKKNAANAARCVDCKSYQSNGTPVLDPGPTPQAAAEAAPTTWKCSVCTLENPVSSAVCEACQSGQRPRHLAPPKTKVSEKKKSGTETRGAQVAKTWPCPTCTYQNAVTKEKCDMCSGERPLQYKPSPPPSTKRETGDAGDDIQWQEDGVALNCNRCHLPFNFARRRHHCRACGFVFCDACSNFQLAVKKNGPLERVCVSCYEANKKE